MLDPRPWCIVFGEALSYEEHGTLCIRHLRNLREFFNGVTLATKRNVITMKDDYSVIFKMTEDFINAFDPSDVFQCSFLEKREFFEKIEFLYIICKNFANYFTYSSINYTRLSVGIYCTVIYRRFPHQYTCRYKGH
jgi:hypothetical protein